MEKHTGAPASNRAKIPKTPASKPSAANPKGRSRVIPDSTPQFKSFAHIRNPKVRRAKEYEQQLLFIQALYPEYSTSLEDDLAYARACQERGRTSDRDRVIKSLGDSKSRTFGTLALSCREVSEDLSIPYPTTYKILKELAETGLVIITQRQGRAGNKPGQGRGGNKPVCYYSLAHTRGAL